MANLLEIQNLSTRFFIHEGVVQAVNGVTYFVASGETVGIVGESGCGKSISMLSVMRLIPSPPGRITSGQVLFQGQDLLKFSEKEMEKVRGAKISMIFQDPMTSLNPTLPIGFQIAEGIKLHKNLNDRQANERVIELLERVGIPRPKDRLNDYPHQFSGGMRQRVMIAIALSCDPQLLIADEPTTALDVTVQAQIIDLVKRLQAELRMTVIWITHDLGVVARLVERVIVMYAGYVIEDAPVDDLFSSPSHPYTQGLLAALPRLNAPVVDRLLSIPGQPPSLIKIPSGCPFSPRCGFAGDLCRKENPVLVSIGERRKVACWEHEKVQTRWPVAH